MNISVIFSSQLCYKIMLDALTSGISHTMLGGTTCQLTMSLLKQSRPRATKVLSEFEQALCSFILLCAFFYLNVCYFFVAV